MSLNLFKRSNPCLKDVFKSTEAGQGTIRDNMDDLLDILEDEIVKSKCTDEEKKEASKYESR